MAYKYPDGAKTTDSIIADVISTVAWIDFVLQLKLAHIAFPIKFGDKVDKNPEQFKDFFEYSNEYIAKISYRGKIDMFFALAKFNDSQLRKGFKTLMIELGKIRNDIAHNAAIGLISNDIDLGHDNVGAKIISEKYKLFNDIFTRLESFVEQLEESMS